MLKAAVAATAVILFASAGMNEVQADGGAGLALNLASNFGNEQPGRDQWRGEAPYGPDRTALPQQERSVDLLERSVDALLALYDLPPPHEMSSDNIFAKHIKSWTGSDFLRVHGDAIKTVLRVILEDRIDLLDRMKPDGMSRGEFVHAILREAQRSERDLLKEAFENIMAAPYYGGGRTREQGDAMRADRLDRSMQLAGDMTLANGQRVVRPGELFPVELAVYHAANDVIATGNPRPLVGADVGDTIYRDMPEVTPAQRAGASFNINSDMRAYALGYLYGGIPEFDLRGNPNALIDGAVSFTDAQGRYRTMGEVHDEYCLSVESIFAPGNAVSISDAAKWGAVQARIDSRTGFVGDDVSFGFTGSC